VSLQPISLSFTCWHMRPNRLPLNDEDVPLLLELATEYDDVLRRSASKRHGRARLVFQLGARIFGVEPAALRSKSRKANNVRLKLMAFARVVSLGDEEPPTSYPKIGRAFHRSHTTACYAVHRYGDAIAGVLGKQLED
jgi:chromosomal replication initiation ATPase DnaA